MLSRARSHAGPGVTVEIPVLASAAVRRLLACSCFAVLLGAPSTARPSDDGKLAVQPAWCAPETEAVAEDVCFFDGNLPERRTLVIFLHGVIARNTTWQWTQERAIVRDARQFHFAAIMPRAPAVGPGGAGGFAWPGPRTDSAALVAPWRTAQDALEARAGRPFDEVFVVGFSSGAYFATALALRDQAKVDGYAVLAGGMPMEPAKDVSHRAPIFIGVSKEDGSTGR